MPGTITVTVAEGRAVRDPDTMQLLPDGEVLVPDNQFYRRRLNDGDVTLVAPPPDPPPGRTQGKGT